MPMHERTNACTRCSPENKHTDIKLVNRTHTTTLQTLYLYTGQLICIANYIAICACSRAFMLSWIKGGWIRYLYRAN